MMKILALALILPCILQVSVCTPNQPQVTRGMEVAESRGLLTSIRDFFGFGPKRPQSGAQKRERPPRPRPHHQRPPNFRRPRPQPLYLPHGHVEIAQYEQPNENHIQINMKHEAFTEHEEVHSGQDSNYNIVSVNNVEFDPSEFTAPHPEDIIYNHDKPGQFHHAQPALSHHHIREQHPQPVQPAFSQQHIREQHPNKGNFVNVHKGSVSWPEEREVHDNPNTNKHIGFSLPKQSNKVPSDISQGSEENKGIPEFSVAHDTHSNIVNNQDFNNLDNSPKPFVESNSVKNSESSSFEPSDVFDGGFGNFFSSSIGFQRDTPSFTTKIPKVVFDLTTYVPPGYKRDSTTIRPYKFTLNGYSPPIYNPTTTSTPTPTTTTAKVHVAPTRKPYFNIASEMNKQKIRKPSPTSYIRNNDDNYGDDDANKNNNDNQFDIQNVKRINSTSFSDQVWHLPTKKPLSKSSLNEGQQKKYIITKGVSLLKSTNQYDSTTPLITTYKPRRVVPKTSKTKRPIRVRLPTRRTTQRSTTVRTTTARSRATLPTLRPFIPPHGTPQRTQPPSIYKSIPKIVAHTTTTTPSPPQTTTTSSTSSTTHRPKRNPDPRINPHVGWKEPQKYNIAVTNNTQYYSNAKPPIVEVDFNENFNKPFDFDKFVPFRSSDEFFGSVFSSENPTQEIPAAKEIKTNPNLESGELVHQSSNSESPRDKLRHSSSEFSRPIAPFNKQPISFSAQREPSMPDEITKFTVSSDSTHRPSLQSHVKESQHFQQQMRDRQPQRTTSRPRYTQRPLIQSQVKHHQNVQKQMKDHEPQRTITSQPRYTQYIRKGTTSTQPIPTITELPKKSGTTVQEYDSQHLGIEGRGQISDDVDANKVSNYPTKVPIKINLVKQTRNTAITPQSPITESQFKTKSESLPDSKPLITSWNSQFAQHSQSTASPSPNLQSHTKRGFTPQIYEIRQHTLPPLHFTTFRKESTTYKEPSQYTESSPNKESTPYTIYQALAQTSPEPRSVSKSQTSSEFNSQPVPVTISPPRGVIIENHFSKEPTFHFGGGYHNWEDISLTSVDPNVSVSTTAKPATTLGFSVTSPLSSAFSTTYNTPRSTTNTAPTSWVSYTTKSSPPVLYYDEASDQGNVGNHKDLSGEQFEFQRGTTQFIDYEDTTYPPIIQGEFEQSDIQPGDMRSPPNNDESWGIKSNINGNTALHSNQASPENTFQRDEDEVPVILVQGSSRPPNNVWTPPTPPSATTRSHRRRRPGKRPTPAGDLAALPRGPTVGPNSNIRRPQTKGRDGLGWNSFPVPLMDLTVSSDMQEMMAQLDGGSMDFMKLPSRGDQKSLSMIPSIESPILFDYEDVGADIPVIPEALEGALEKSDANIYSSQIMDEETKEDINIANKDSFKRSPTEKDFPQQSCLHGFCEEEFLDTDDK